MLTIGGLLAPVAAAAAWPCAPAPLTVLQGDFVAAAAAAAGWPCPEERVMLTTDGLASEPDFAAESEEPVAEERYAESLALGLANGISPGPVEFEDFLPLLVSRLACAGAPRASMLWKEPDMSL